MAMPILASALLALVASLTHAKECAADQCIRHEEPAGRDTVVSNAMMQTSATLRQPNGVQAGASQPLDHQFGTPAGVTGGVGPAISGKGLEKAEGEGKGADLANPEDADKADEAVEDERIAAEGPEVAAEEAEVAADEAAEESEAKEVADLAGEFEEQTVALQKVLAQAAAKDAEAAELHEEAALRQRELAGAKDRFHRYKPVATESDKENDKVIIVDPTKVTITTSKSDDTTSGDDNDDAATTTADDDDDAATTTAADDDAATTAGDDVTAKTLSTTEAAEEGSTTAKEDEATTASGSTTKAAEGSTTAKEDEATTASGSTTKAAE